MEIRSSSWRCRVLLCSVLLSKAVAGCGTLETESGVLGRSHVCASDVFQIGRAAQNPENLSNIEFASPASSSPNHEVRSSPGKGLGVFATEFIAQGTTVLLEAPLISVSTPEMVPGQGFRIADMVSDISSAFARLSSSQQDEVLSLHDFRFASEDEAGSEQSHLLTIFRSNAYNTGDDRIGLFPKTARINHSCRPSAGNWWSEKLQRRIIYAMRDIRVGEEVTVAYIPLLKTTRERQVRLQQYGFTCDCEACGDETGVGDTRRVKIGDWLEDLEGKVGRKSMKVEVSRKRGEKARKLVEMVETEGLGDYIARAFHLVAVFSEHAGDFEEAKLWAWKEQQVFEWAEKDSEEALASARYLKSLKNR